MCRSSPAKKAPADLIYELPEGEYCNVHGPAEVPDLEDIVDDIPDIPNENSSNRNPMDSTFSMNLTRHSREYSGGMTDKKQP